MESDAVAGSDSASGDDALAADAAAAAGVLDPESASAVVAGSEAGLASFFDDREVLLCVLVDDDRVGAADESAAAEESDAPVAGSSVGGAAGVDAAVPDELDAEDEDVSLEAVSLEEVSLDEVSPDEPEPELESVDPADPDGEPPSVLSAHATVGAANADPMPNATARAPTRPTCRAYGASAATRGPVQYDSTKREPRPR